MPVRVSQVNKSIRLLTLIDPQEAEEQLEKLELYEIQNYSTSQPKGMANSGVQRMGPC